MRTMPDMRRWVIALVVALALFSATSCSQPSASSPAPAAPQLTPTAPPASPAPSLASTPAAPEPSPVAAGHFAWPTAMPPGLQLRPDRSALADGQLTLTFTNQADAQDEVTITSMPDAGGGFGAPCRDAVTVRDAAGASCSTGAGVTVEWVEQGWRYRVGGGLLSTERAVAVAESLEFVDQATAEQRLQEGGTP
jgi:hypothetical protein